MTSYDGPQVPLVTRHGLMNQQKQKPVRAGLRCLIDNIIPLLGVSRVHVYSMLFMRCNRHIKCVAVAVESKVMLLLLLKEHDRLIVGELHTRFKTQPVPIYITQCYKVYQ